MNSTGRTLHNVRAHYFFVSEDGEEPVVESYYVPRTRASIERIDSVNFSLDVDVDSLPEGLFPDEGGLSIGLHHADWSAVEKDDDYSYLQSSGFGINENIPVIADSLYSWGNIPDFYTPSELSCKSCPLSDPEPFSLNDGVKIVLKKDEPLRFAWMPVPGARSYRLSVYSKDTSLLYQKELAGFSDSVELDAGKYLWSVEAFSGRTAPASKPIWNRVFRYIEKVIESTYVESRSLDVTPFAARKDTKLLNVNWGEFADLRKWDESHVGNEHWDEEESWRCWAVAINELNNYYGGSLTQDEIKMYGMRDRTPNKITGLFALGTTGSMTAIEIRNVLSWALNTSTENIFRLPTRTEIKNDIDNGKPLLIGIGAHIMVLSAYRVNLMGKMEIRLLNPRNDGGFEWRVLNETDSTENLGWWRYGAVSKCIKGDSSINLDSDGDGIMDYDEIVRFGTDPLKVDSDSDGIDDKTEIHSHTIREAVSFIKLEEDTAMQPLNPIGNAFVMTPSKEVWADVDGDGKRAENDPDSDNDGIPDGEEDRNHNGLVDEGETDPYVADGTITPEYAEMDVPGDFALYSLDRLSVNDGVHCHVTSMSVRGYLCNFASESKADYFSMMIGVQDSAISLYSKGGIFLRNRASVETVRLYNHDGEKPKIRIQNGAEYTTALNIDSLNWAWNVNRDLASFDVGNENKIVKSGETYMISGGDNFKSLKIEAGGTLKFGTGEMFAGSLQVESGANVEFVNPGYETILHINGTCIWRGDILPFGNTSSEVKDEYLSNRLKLIAEGFKLVQHDSATTFIEGLWAGTIFAPRAELVLGQANKTIYGRFLGHGITVHQYADLAIMRYAPLAVVASTFFKEEK